LKTNNAIIADDAGAKCASVRAETENCAKGVVAYSRQDASRWQLATSGMDVRRGLMHNDGVATGLRLQDHDYAE